MQEEKKSKCLVLHRDTIEMVRKEINLEKTEDMTQSVNILKEWVEMQPHFKKRDFSDFYLETCIVASKGSVERAKSRLDKMCTMRTLIPHFFEEVDVTKDFTELFKVLSMVICPKLTKDHHRVFITKPYEDLHDANIITMFYKYGIYIAEYQRRYDYVLGFRIVYDFRAVDVVKFVTKLNIVESRQAISLFMEGYGMKIKGIHIISQSRSVDLFVNIMKQLLKPKLANRISVHKTSDELHGIIEKDVLPVELGGNERPVKELHEDWLAELSTEEFKKYMRDMNKAGTDESLRPRDKFNEDYAGMPGTFRILRID